MSFYFLQQSEILYMYNVSKIYQTISFTIGSILYFLFLLERKFKLKELLVYVLAGVVIFTVLLSLRDRYFFVAFAFMLSGRKINLEKLVRFDIKMKVLAFIVIFGLCQAGFLQNYTRVINGAYKQAFGFAQPNTFAAFLVTILVEWIFLRYEKMKLFEAIVIGMLTFGIWTLAASRTIIYAFVFISILLVLYRIFPRLIENKIVEKILVFLPVIGLALSFLLINLYNSGNHLIIALDTFATGRIKHASNLINKYGVSLFGQLISTRGTRTIHYAEGAMLNVDMSYIRVPVHYGILILGLIIIGNVALSYRAIKNKEIKLALMIAFFAIVGIGETHFYLIQYNFTMFMLLTFDFAFRKSVIASEGKNFLCPN